MPAAGVIGVVGQASATRRSSAGRSRRVCEYGAASAGFSPAANSESQPSAAGPHGCRRRGCAGDHDPLASVVAQLFSSCPRACCRAARFRSRNERVLWPCVQGVRYRGTCPWRQVPSGMGANPPSRGPTRLENFRYEALGCRRGLRRWPEGGGVRAGYSDVCGGLVKRAFLQGDSRCSVTRRWCGMARGDLLRGRVGGFRSRVRYVGVRTRNRRLAICGHAEVEQRLKSRAGIESTTNGGGTDFALLDGASVRCDV